MPQQVYDAIVIGAGGAGMIASWRAAASGADVLLLERNTRLGTKLLISGGGKCNITHAGNVTDVLAAFSVREARFLKPSMFRFSNDDVLALLEREGLPTEARENGRVFPVSGSARDVVETFHRLLVRENVTVKTGARVERINAHDGAVVGVIVSGETFSGNTVIVATGGVSYPKTGTTGDGYRWARELGHTIIPLRPALAPIGVVPALPADWRGVALRGGVLSVMSRGKTINSWRGDILFSHEGITGPAALEMSRDASVAAETGRVQLAYDFFPHLEFTQLDTNFTAFVEKQRARTIGNVLEEWLPNRLVPALLAIAAVDPETRGYVLTRDQRRAIVHLLKSWELGTVGKVAIERGEVTAGGIDLNEVNPQTMRSRVVKNLCLCGEILDIAGPVGGYNLQAAFSTGYVAGEDAARVAGRK